MRLKKIIIEPIILNLLYIELSNTLLNEKINNNSIIALKIISFSKIFKPLKIKNFDKKSKSAGKKKLGHFIPINGCIEETIESVIFTLVVILLYESDMLEKLIDSSMPIIGPKTTVNFFSFFFAIIKKKNEKISDKK